ncbi:MAG: hypothetical protein R3C18_08410 [Planctomycetaceae bacterium]
MSLLVSFQEKHLCRACYKKSYLQETETSHLRDSTDQTAGNSPAATLSNTGGASSTAPSAENSQDLPSRLLPELDARLKQQADALQTAIETRIQGTEKFLQTTVSQVSNLVKLHEKPPQEVNLWQQLAEKVLEKIEAQETEFRELIGRIDKSKKRAKRKEQEKSAKPNPQVEAPMAVAVEDSGEIATVVPEAKNVWLDLEKTGELADKFRHDKFTPFLRSLPLLFDGIERVFHTVEESPGVEPLVAQLRKCILEWQLSQRLKPLVPNPGSLFDETRHVRDQSFAIADETQDATIKAVVEPGYQLTGWGEDEGDILLKKCIVDVYFYEREHGPASDDRN